MKRDDEPLDEAEIAAGHADFFARVSHDLRSPVGVLEEVVALLARDPATAPADERETLHRLGARSVARLRVFAERMRLLADLEGELRLVPAPLDLASVVGEAVDATRAAESRRGVDVELAAPEPVRTRADAAKLAIIVRELVSNAIRNARSKVRVSVEDDTSSARVIVEDDGDGIAEELRARLFRRFVARPSRSGLGVGLSIARDLARAHGGDLALEDRALAVGRRGARLVLRLPRA